MNGLYIGGVEPSSMGAIDKLYVGAELVWPTAVPPAVLDHVVKVSHSSASGAATASIPFPTGAAAGMAIIFLNRALNTTITGTPPDKVLPPDYIDLNLNFQPETFEVCRFAMSFKILTQADVDAALPLTGMGGNGMNHRLAILFKGVDDVGALVPLSNVFPEQLVNGFSNATLSTQTQDINGTWQNPKGINVAVYASSAAVNPRTWTGSQAHDEEISITTTFYCKYMVNGANANPLTVSMQDEGNMNTLISALLGFQ